MQSVAHGQTAWLSLRGLSELQNLKSCPRLTELEPASEEDPLVTYMYIKLCEALY